MSLPLDPHLPVNMPVELRVRLYEILRDISNEHNKVAGGRISGLSNTGTSAPTTGTWLEGDVVRNSSPAEAGSGGSKYVVFGWICTVSGTPGTWNEMRCLTGN